LGYEEGAFCRPYTPPRQLALGAVEEPGKIVPPRNERVNSAN